MPVRLKDEVSPLLRTQFGIQIAESGQTHVGLVTLPERCSSDRDVVARTATVWQAPGHAPSDKVVGFGGPESLQEVVSLQRLARRHADVS